MDTAIAQQYGGPTYLLFAFKQYRNNLLRKKWENSIISINVCPALLGKTQLEPVVLVVHVDKINRTTYLAYGNVNNTEQSSIMVTTKLQ